MCKAMEERIDRERIKILFWVVTNFMEILKMTAEQTMAVLKISDTDGGSCPENFSGNAPSFGNAFVIKNQKNCFLGFYK